MLDTVGTGSAAVVKAALSAVGSKRFRDVPTVLDGVMVATENCTVTPVCAKERRPKTVAEMLVMAIAEVETFSAEATPEMKAACAAAWKEAGVYALREATRKTGTGRLGAGGDGDGGSVGDGGGGGCATGPGGGEGVTAVVLGGSASG